MDEKVVANAKLPTASPVIADEYQTCIAISFTIFPSPLEATVAIAEGKNWFLHATSQLSLMLPLGWELQTITEEDLDDWWWKKLAKTTLL